MSEYLTDGHPTTVTFDALGTGVTLLLKETTVTPPGIAAGGENDTTTMRNTVWRTKQPKQIPITFADNSTLDFWGWLDDFTPGETVEGAMPVATGTIMCSNQNTSGVEIAPDYVAAP